MADSAILFKFDILGGAASIRKKKFSEKQKIEEENVYLWPDQFMSNFPSASQCYTHIRMCQEHFGTPESDMEVVDHIEELLYGKHITTVTSSDVTNSSADDAKCCVEKMKNSFHQFGFDIHLDLSERSFMFAISFNTSHESGGLLHQRIQEILDKCAMTDSQFDDEDQFPGCEQFQISSQSTVSKDEEDFYFPNQVAIGKIIVERIKLLLGQKNKSFLDFKKFKFQIYTARFNMLLEQTYKRLTDERSHCFPEEHYRNPEILHRKAEKRVQLYNMSSDVKERQEKLRNKAKHRPDTLFLIVGDEAHWGTCQRTDTGNESAANALLNMWTDEYPNVFVLLVTATPYNLLTETSRIPLDISVARSLEDPGKWHHVEEAGYSGHFEIVDKNSREKLTGKTGPVRNLHIIKWTEGITDVLRNGMTLKLKVFTKKRCMLLYAAEEDTHPDQLKWTTKENAGYQYDSFRITITDKSKQGVKIETRDEKFHLVVIPEKESGICKGRLAFYRYEMSQKNPDRDYQSEFFLDLNSGYGIFELRVNLESDPKKPPRISAIGLNDKTGDIELLSRLPNEMFHEGVDFGFSVHTNETSFLIESQDEDVEEEKEYLSMNKIFNSMRNEDTSHQLIREDKIFQRVMSKLKSEPVDILAAEYCYNILVVPLFKRSLVANSMGEILKSPNTAIDSYHTNKTELLTAFEQSLSERHETESIDQFKPILRTTFEDYHSYMAEIAKDSLSGVSIDLLEGSITEEEFIVTVLSTLLYLDHKTVLSVVPAGIQQEKEVAARVERKFTELKSKGFSGILQKSLAERETSRIVSDLSRTNSSSDEHIISGHMTVVRIGGAREGNRLYKSLIMARNVSWDQHFPFEVIRDFGKFRLKHEIKDNAENSQPIQRICKALQYSGSCAHVSPQTKKICSCTLFQPGESALICQRCKHQHKLVKTYEDLRDLPCILILDQKGRMGDTFPSTLNALDCRLGYTGGTNPQIYLSTFVQEIGRLCRYTSHKDKENLPYALIGKNPGDMLNISLSQSASYYAAFMSSGMLDRHVLRKNKNSTKKGIGQAKESSYDYNNNTVHGNRLLLMAEPQIGKTGAYLYAISEIQRIIHPPNDEESSDEYTSSEEEPDDDSADIEKDEGEYVDKWKFPFWRSLKYQGKLRKESLKSKYASAYGPYRQGCKPENLMREGWNREKRKSHSQKVVQNIGSTYRAHDHSHECKTCKIHGTNREKAFQFESNTVKVSLPHTSSDQFHPLIEKIMELQCPDDHKTLHLERSLDRANKPLLKTWIFTPSHQRAEKGCFNLSHTMMDQSTNQVAQHIHVIVVRKSDFAEYCTKWGATHAILQLPDTMVDCETDVDEGGVGYARLFIQKLAETFRLPYIFMLDDDIFTMARAVEVNGKISRTETGMIEWENLPFYEVLKHLEDQIRGEGNVPKKLKYEPFDPNRQLPEVYQYCGTPECYGVTGFLKFRPTIGKVKQPFQRQHVYSCVLLNINALREKEIWYRPWQVFEDCNLNNDADDKGLWVCKYSKYVMMKKPSRRWFSEMYYWTKSTNLAFNPTQKTPTDQCDRLVSWIEKSHTPKEVIPWPQEHGPPTNSEFFTRLNNCSKLNGRNVTLLVESSRPDFVVKRKLLQDRTRHFLATTDDAGISKHLVILPTELLRKLHLITLKNIKDFFANGLEDFLPTEVISTHDPNIYDTKFAVVFLERKQKRTRCENADLGKGPSRTQMTHEKTQVHDHPVTKQERIDQTENGLDNTKTLCQNHNRNTGNREVSGRYFLPFEEMDENINKYVGDLYLLETYNLSAHLAGILFYRDQWNRHLIIRPLVQWDSSTIASAISQIFADFGQPYVLQSSHDTREMNRIVYELKVIHPGLDILIRYKEEEELQLLGEKIKKELQSQPPKNILYHLREQQMCWNEQYGLRGDQRGTLTELQPRMLPNPETSQFEAIFLKQNPIQFVYRVKGKDLSRSASSLSTITRGISGTGSTCRIDEHRNSEDGTRIPSASQPNAKSDMQSDTRAASSASEEGGRCSFEHALSTHNNHYRHGGTKAGVQNLRCISGIDATEQGVVEGEILTPKLSTSKRHACSDTEIAAKQLKLTNSDDSFSTSGPKIKCGCRTKCKTRRCACRKAGTLCTKGVCHRTEPDCDNLTEARDQSHSQFPT